MRLVIKKKEQTEDKFLKCDNFADISFQEFSDKADRYTKNQIRKLYKRIFGRECSDPIWGKYQIHYELARQMYIKRGEFCMLQKGSQFREHYKGTMARDLNRTGETIRTLIPYEMKHNEENTQEYQMKKQNKINAIKKAAEVKKTTRVGITLGLSVPETWIHVFVDNAKSHKADEELSKFMHAEFPDLKNKAFDTVHGCRIHYNNGGYTKGVKPAVKSVRYLADGTEWKRGHKAAAVKPAKVAPAKKVVVKKVAKKAK